MKMENIIFSTVLIQKKHTQGIGLKVKEKLY